MSYDLKIVNGDLSLNKNGQVNLVVGNEKLIQEVTKIVLTDVGENKYHPYYGSSAGKLDIGGAYDESMHRSEIERSVRESLNNLIVLKNSQRLSQELNPAETIVSIDNITVFRDSLDPRMWSIDIALTTMALDDIKTSVKIRI